MKRLYNKLHNSYAEWNGSAWEDKNISGAYFYSIQKANNNGYYLTTKRNFINFKLFNTMSDKNWFRFILIPAIIVWAIIVISVIKFIYF